MDKLVEECSENLYENETLDIIPLETIPLNAIPLNVYKKVCNFCVVYIVLLVVFLTAGICICCDFIFLLVFKKR